MAWSTNIFEIAKANMREYEKTIPADQQAIKVYAESLAKIQKIEWTDGYNAIKTYWKKEFSVALSEIWKINAIDNPGMTTKLQERLDLSNRFLYYLSVFENKG
jgi:hypothetical protein